MYSILIRDNTDATKWTYHLDSDEAIWNGSKTEAQVEVQKLLLTVTLNRIKVVHNTALTAAFTIDDVSE